MYSSENVCNLIKKQRDYQKLNHLKKSININIGHEDGHAISARTNFVINKITSCLNFSSSIVYRKKNIAPAKYGKLNCKNLDTIEMFSRKNYKYQTTNAKTLNEKTVERRRTKIAENHEYKTQRELMSKIYYESHKDEIKKRKRQNYLKAKAVNPQCL